MVQPSGTVTFIYTEIQGSSALWEAREDDMRIACRLHDQTLQRLFSEFEGYVFTTGGHRYCVAFNRADRAIWAASQIQIALAKLAWPVGCQLTVRVAVHTDAVEAYKGSYFGRGLNRIERLLEFAQGGQVLLTASTCELVRGRMPEGTHLRHLGLRALREIPEPLDIYELIGEGGGGPQPVTRGDLLRIGVHVDEGLPFVGRAQDIEAINRLIDEGDRLITITGVGGLGKTRLACRIAELRTPDFTDGAVIVDVGSIDSEAEFFDRISQALRHPEPPSWSILLRSARDRHLLVVLDCLERMPSLTPRIRELIDAMPHGRVIATSRVALGLPLECEFPLSPLAGGKARTEDATRIFLEVARHAGAKWPDDKIHRTLVSQIVADLEGIPLALSLAASRLRSYGLAELRDRIRAARLDTLRKRTSGDQRHANMRRVIQDSLDLIPESAGQLLGGLSVFVAGFFRRDALAACLPEFPNADDDINLLHEHSLLQASESNGELRLRLLDSVREYAIELFPPSASLRGRFAEQMAQRAASAEALFSEGRWVEASHVLSTELANFRSAIHFLQETDPPSAARMVRSLARPCLESGSLAEFDELVSLGHRIGDDNLRFQLLGLAGAAALRRGDRPAGIDLWQMRRDAAAKAGDQETWLDSTYDLAEAALEDGNLSTAHRLTSEALRSLRTKPESAWAATGRALLALIALKRQQSRRALRHVARAEASITADDRIDLSLFVSRASARVGTETGSPALARQASERMLDRALATNRLYFVVAALEDLAQIHVASEDWPSGLASAVAAAQLSGEIGGRHTRRLRERVASMRLAAPIEDVGGLIAAARSRGWRSISQSLLPVAKPLA